MQYIVSLELSFTLQKGFRTHDYAFAAAVTAGLHCTHT